MLRLDDELMIDAAVGNSLYWGMLDKLLVCVCGDPRYREGRVIGADHHGSCSSSTLQSSRFRLC